MEQLRYCRQKYIPRSKEFSASFSRRMCILASISKIFKRVKLIVNNHLVLISGKSATGKTASLRNLKDPEKVIYLNAEANKALPFPAKFKQLTVTDPYQVFEAFDYAEAKDFHTIVIDSLSFLMDMYESIHVVPAADGRKAWGSYAQFFKQLMQEYVAKSTKNIVFLAHTSDVYNEKEFIQETMVKVKGSLMNQGVEAYFSHVISTKKLSLKAVEEVNNPLLTITDDDKIAGVKYVLSNENH